MPSHHTASPHTLTQQDLRTLVCPVCHAGLQLEAQAILCTGCGRRYPVVGRVTMNTLMADVTGDQDRIKLDDEVVLFGRQGDAFISQKELEDNSASYGPDLLAVMGNSLPKMMKPA